MLKSTTLRLTYLYAEQYSAYGWAEAAGHAHCTGRRQHLRVARLVRVDTLQRKNLFNPFSFFWGGGERPPSPMGFLAFTLNIFRQPIQSVS